MWNMVMTRVFKETAACCFIGYYISVLANIRLILKPISADTGNVPIISYIPSLK